MRETFFSFLQVNISKLEYFINADIKETVSHINGQKCKRLFDMEEEEKGTPAEMIVLESNRYLAFLTFSFVLLSNSYEKQFFCHLNQSA